MIAQFQVYLRTRSGFETYCYTKFGRALKNARRAADKARLAGGFVQIANRVVWTASQGWAADIAARLAQEAAERVKSRARGHRQARQAVSA